jgi:hypothetical protein
MARVEKGLSERVIDVCIIIRFLQEQADEGSAEAQFNYGTLPCYGDDIPIDQGCSIATRRAPLYWCYYSNNESNSTADSAFAEKPFIPTTSYNLTWRFTGIVSVFTLLKHLIGVDLYKI